MTVSDNGSAIISQYLGYDEQIKIVSRLVEEDQLSQVLGVLNIISIDFSGRSDLIDTLFENVRSKLLQQMESLDSKSFTGYGDSAYNELISDKELRVVAQLICKIEPLWYRFESWIVQELESYVARDHKKLFENVLYEQLVDTQGRENGSECDLNEVDTIFLLKFLETVYSFGVEISKAEKLDDIILLLLGCNVEILAFTASGILRWRIDHIARRALKDSHFDQVVWTLIKQYVDDGMNRDWKLRSALIFTLRFLLVSEPSSQLVTLLKTGEYWQNLQFALSHKVQEYRKLGICVLRLTIEKLASLPISFETDIFTWDPAHKDEYLKIWDNFTTLYEIVALETALNQIQAATSQILNLFANHILHPTWGLILLSTGLKATMDSVRKYMVSMLFMIDDKSVFTSNVKALKKTFLPAALEAHYFTVKGSSCPYGERFSNWITSIISQSKENASVAISVSLEYLVEQPTLFDPSRVYLTFGIINSLKGKNSRLISPYHLELIKKLFEVESEEGIVETTLQTMNLKFLLHTDYSTSPEAWIQTISSHVKNNKNGYKFFAPLIEDFIDFAIAYFKTEDIDESFASWVQVDETFGLLSVLILGYENISITRPLIFELSKSGICKDEFNSKASEALSGLLAGDENVESYEGADVLVDYAGFNSYTWKSIKLDKLYGSLLKEFSESKFKFLVTVYEKTFDNDAELLELTWSNLKQLYNIVKDFLGGSRDFKFKDEIYGTYMKFLFIHLKAFPVNWEGYDKKGDEVTELLSLLSSNVTNENGNYKGNLYISKLCTYVLDSYVTVGKGVADNNNWNLLSAVINVFLAIWEEVFSERLILNQKNLHDALIEGLFHPTVLYYATENSEKGAGLAAIISNCGQGIIDQAYTRRGYLPLLAQNINEFIRSNAEKLDDNKADYWWLINLILGILSSTQMNVNIFFLRPVIAELYDKKINLYQAGGKSLYEQVYGPEEISAKVLIIDTFLYCGAHFKEQALVKAARSTNLLFPKKQTDGIEEIKRVQTWQLLLLGIKVYDKSLLFNFVKDSVLPSLSDDISPLVRAYKEWFTAYVIADHYEEGKTNVVEDLVFSSMDDQTKPAVTVSHERIAFLVLVGLTSANSDCPQRLLNRFMGSVISNATSNKPLVRHFSNSLMLSFWPSFSQFITNETLKQIIHQLYLGAEQLRIPGKYRVGDANTWNIYEDLNLTGVFGGVLRRTSSAEVPYFSEGLFNKYLSYKGWTIGTDDTSSFLIRRIDQEHSNGEFAPDSSSQLQMKSGAWKTLMDIDNSKPEKTVNRSDLIVVASLVDKAPNLGGICRLCDVLGVGLLTVPNIKVKNNPQFKNVAVTADRWMPIEEVTPQDITSFMKQKKQEGYTLIGLEQTDKSVKLDDHYKFPAKSLVVLGTEAHGIPGHLLSELDLCLEIRQFGVIRSMNIQTATAVIVHSYTVQHM
ncbi:hypothetical protein ZYGR_0S02430 [Zygosaccharomyces rouxii]|uniref:ZYRO0F07942p n=2 Tax=Zygosaccharomyces rouxii TaxID=4956 RepID=C5DXU8_ZYGRC|nr:uncharacterized protein ZYRO0F07942g [Zygosaccharomyces rouxii]KAH9199367.1 hypothetical protein LQ764DRAFT_129492 [Zygosaccharomyces rouxii]GAV50109.1 hypothetical protein ZYGR_0S02430 [Zygosaccharomyces rouxii]CAR28609.1 ZYRO0F07942p [Zygosaccharomyces rouxii]